MFVAAFLWLSLPMATAQDVLVVQEVVPVAEPSDVLYRRARAWIADTFRDADAVISLEDPEEHLIKGNGVEPFATSFLVGSQGTSGYIRYQLTIETKEGRYRFTVGPFSHDATGLYAMDFGVLTTAADSPGAGSPSWRRRCWDEMKASARNIAARLSSSLRTAMLRPPTSRPSDDW